MSKFDNFEHMKLLTQPLNSINLIKIIKPKKIFFGEKDMQQLKIMENFI